MIPPAKCMCEMAHTQPVEDEHDEFDARAAVPAAAAVEENMPVAASM